MRERRGAVVLLVAVCLVALAAVVALVIDIGAVQRERRMAQAAADAGARAAADEILRNRSSTEVENAALRETARNGYATGGDVEVTVTYPTSSVNAAGSNFARVDVQRSVSMKFASIIGIPAMTVQAHAVAGLGSANSACLTITEPSAADALLIKSGSLRTIGCSIMVNSTSPNAVTTLATPSLIAPSIAVVGGPATTPIGVSGPYSSGVPLPPTGSDPYSNLTMPDVGSCNGSYGQYQNFNGTALSPGVYCGGISIKTGSVNFSPGLYIIAGGGLYLKQTTVIGNGVTFVFTNAPDANGGAANFDIPGEPGTVIDMEVNSIVQFSAMTTGSFAGVLFYADPAAGVAGTTYTSYLYSSSTGSFYGAVYMPNETLEAKSNSDLTLNGAVVVKRLQITTGNQNITINGPSSGSDYYGLKQPTIVE